MTDSLHADDVSQKSDPPAEPHPAWTIRCTWRVTDPRDEPFRTYHAAADEPAALDRAAYMLDHYRAASAAELVCVHILHPTGAWFPAPNSPHHHPPRRPEIRPLHHFRSSDVQDWTPHPAR